MLDKCKESKTDPYLALLNLRTTPNSSGSSPSQLLMSRLLRTKLPILNENLRPKLIDVHKHNNKIRNIEAKVTEH